MNPSLPLYALAGAVSFTILSAMATKYRGDTIQSKSLVRDAVAGGLFTAVLIALVPDVFPVFNTGLAAAAVTAVSSIKMPQLGGSSSGASSDDLELQVGWPSKR
jgi:hypothetical protein